MTKKVFKELLREKHKFKRTFEYVIAILPIGAGLFFIYKLTFTDWLQTIETLDKMSPTSIYIGSFVFILFGIWGLRKIKLNYEIVSVSVDNVPTDQEVLATWLSENLSWTILDTKSETLKFTTRGFWTSGYEIILVCDAGQVHFDVQHYSIGIIDFGFRKRIIRNLLSELKRPAYNNVHVP